MVDKHGVYDAEMLGGDALMAGKHIMKVHEPPRYYRPDIDDNIDRIVNAMRFYMHLHAWKGSVYDTTVQEDMYGVARNYFEFLEAVKDDDKREILAEGIGLINHAWFVIEKLSKEELDGVQDWEGLLDRVAHDDPQLR